MTAERNEPPGAATRAWRKLSEHIDSVALLSKQLREIASHDDLVPEDWIYIADQLLLAASKRETCLEAKLALLNLVLEFPLFSRQKKLRAAMDGAAAADSAGLYADALKLSKIQIGLCNPSDGHRTIAQAQIRIAMMTAFLGDLERSLELLNDTALTPEIDDDIRAIVASNRALVLKKLHRLDEAIDALTQSQQINRRLGNLSGASKDLTDLAMTWMKIGEYNQSIEQLDDAEALATVGNDLHQVAVILLNRAICLSQMARHDEEIKSIERAKPIFEEMNDGVGVALSLHHLGSANMSLGRYADAADWFQHALREMDRLQLRSYYPTAAVPLMDLLLRMDRIDEAEALLRTERQNWPKHDNDPTFLEVEATIELAHCNAERALEVAGQAASRYLEQELRGQVYRPKLLQCEASLLLRNFELAREFADQAYEAATVDADGNAEAELAALLALAECRKALGHIKEATDMCKDIGDAALRLNKQHHIQRKYVRRLDDLANSLGVTPIEIP